MKTFLDAHLKAAAATFDDVRRRFRDPNDVFTTPKDDPKCLRSFKNVEAADLASSDLLLLKIPPPTYVYCSLLRGISSSRRRRRQGQQEASILRHFKRGATS